MNYDEAAKIVENTWKTVISYTEENISNEHLERKSLENKN